MATIQDVARAAGVSPMTVSHVINDRPNVRASTRARVLQAIDELDYRVNLAARNLRTGRTGTIGLAVPEVDRPYFGQLAARIIAYAQSLGLRIAIEQTGRSKDGELSALAWSRNRLYDGLILSTVGLGPEDVDLLKVDFPVVLLGERIFEGPVDHLAMPNVEGSKAGVAHLIERGCRRIAIMGGDDIGDVGMTNLRFQGYLEAHGEAGLEVDETLIVQIGEFTMANSRDAIARLHESGAEFDGLFCVTDTLAIGALRGLADRGVRVPEDVKVLGYDAIAEGEFLVPSLTSIAPDHDAMARTAIDLLRRRIEDRSSLQREELVSSFTLVERESTASP